MPTQDLLHLTYFRGRVALNAILRALNIGAGDEVATQAYTCLAVPEAIIATGSRPTYIDITASGYNLCPDDLARKLCSRTRAIVVQHTFGIPADIGAIRELARHHNIPLIEDCCHTFASTFEDQVVGTFGAAAFYSFEWGKPVVAGVGGSAVVHDAELAARMQRAYAAFGSPSLSRQLRLELQYLAFHLLYRPRFYWPLRTLFHRSSKFGVAEGNYNPVDPNNDIATDFGLRMAPRSRLRLCQAIQRVDQHSEHARWVAGNYQRAAFSPTVIHPVAPIRSDTVFARYPLQVADKPRLLAQARERGIEMAEWYNTPIHPLPAEQATAVFYTPETCPNAEARAREVISLPTHRRVGQRYIEQATELLSRVA